MFFLATVVVRIMKRLVQCFMLVLGLVSTVSHKSRFTWHDFIAMKKPYSLHFKLASQELLQAAVFDRQANRSKQVRVVRSMRALRSRLLGYRLTSLLVYAE